MFNELKELLGEPSGTYPVTTKGKGTLEFYRVPKEKLEKVANILGVTLRGTGDEPEHNWHPEPFVEVFIPERGRKTAEICCAPWNQTDDPYISLSVEVVL